MSAVRLADFISSISNSPLGQFANESPWALTSNAEEIVRAIIPTLNAAYRVYGDTAVHESATIEPGAAIKGAAIIGPACFVASTALVRGGCWLEGNVIIGPAAELKTSFVFAGSKLAHLNFVGDSVLGGDVNVEAGAMIANYRNERDDKRIYVRHLDRRIDTGVSKFGSLVGDGGRVGANAVLAPGTILPPRTIVPRLGLVDQTQPV